MIKEGEDALHYYNELREKNLILLECIVGSQAYGTNIEGSDIDKKFIYLDTLENVLLNKRTAQLNISKDYVGYELTRFVELLKSNNPNIIELLAPPEDTVIFMSSVYSTYFFKEKYKFLTSEIANTFGKYAYSQINKARGTNKKVANPMPKKRKTLLDFCWMFKLGSIPLRQFLKENNLHPKNCGCTAIDHTKYCYNLFYPENGKGIISKDGVQIVLSSIGKGLKPIGTFYCNLEGFQSYCKEYKEYWDWVANRNEARYAKNMAVGKGYDTKNMAHCIRLLIMCQEILSIGKINVRRPKRDIEYLLDIRNGKFSFEELLKIAEDLKKDIDAELKETPLPEKIPDEFYDHKVLEVCKIKYSL